MNVPFPLDSALLGMTLKHGVPAIEDTELQTTIAVAAANLAVVQTSEALKRLREFLTALNSPSFE